jgi:hypothetical protein
MNRIMKEMREVLKPLSVRQQEVLVRRFGLQKLEPETLAEIGARFGITRERVRQIEAAAMKPLKEGIEAHPTLSMFVREARAALEAQGGVMVAHRFLDYCRAQCAGVDEPHLILVAEATKAFSYYAGDRHFHSFYYASKTHLRDAKSFLDAWERTLSEKKTAVLAGGYERELRSCTEARGVALAHAENYLAISRKIHRSPYGDVGLASWPEVNPQTIRDRIYLVLKKGGAPAHFRKIAELITAAKFDGRPALAATVHNELIKDSRFVLVGRGIYALKEQGYETGTAREVIKKILSEQGALHPHEVVLAAQKGWFFKPNTILVNLQNRNHFERLGDGRYRVLKA